MRVGLGWGEGGGEQVGGGGGVDKMENPSGVDKSIELVPGDISFKGAVA